MSEHIHVSVCDDDVSPVYLRVCACPHEHPAGTCDCVLCP